ncbi:MAG: ferredoxin [Sulfurovum sp.]|nr:MAG: ferredoxin [Sulfurovum sp.]
MKLHFDAGLCVRAKSKLSTCTKCMDAAPESIGLHENLPSFKAGIGIEAAACIGACPTEAFSLSDFSTTEFFFSFLDSKVHLISPATNIPCISVLSVEHLISLALASEEPVVLDLASYQSGDPVLKIITERVEEANFFLSSFSDKQIETNSEEVVATESDKESGTPSRRDFLANASLKGALKHKKAFEEAVEEGEQQIFEIEESMITKIKDKHLPDKRKILFTTLKHAGIPDAFEVLPEEEVSFVSQKYIDDACTNCQICYRICPTGALSTDKKFSMVNFDAMLCVKCHLCHDVCEPDAIHLQPGFEIKELFEPTQRTLAKFDIKRCNECGNPFTYTGGEQICPRCALEEEEAITLHANAKKKNSNSEE